MSIRRLAQVHFILVWAVASAGCSSDVADVGEAYTVRDSTGVVIVENYASLVDVDPWHLSDEPILKIGSVTGPDEYRFHWVNGATRLADGRLVVTNGGSQEIRFYNEEGAYLGSIGGEGEGPGEYQFPTGLWRTVGDSLNVWDDRLRRMTVMDSEGNFGRTTLANPSPMSLFPIGVRPDGTWVMSVIEMAPGTTDYRVNDATLLTYRPTGELADSVAVLPWWELKSMRPFSAGRLFGWRASVAAAPGGIWYGDSREYEVMFLDDQGQVLRMVRWMGPDRTILPGHVGAYWEERIGEAASRGTEAVQRMQELREKQPVADQFPAFSHLMVDALGNLWVRDEERPGDDSDQLWTVFTGEGELRAVVHLPRKTRVLEIGVDYLILLATDELNVQHIHLYALTRTGRN